MTHYTVQFNGVIPELASYSRQSGTRAFSRNARRLYRACTVQA